MAASFILALAQLAGSRNPEENTVLARQWAREASDNGASVLVFPEMFMALPRKSGSLAAIAEPLDGDFVTHLRRIAQDCHVYLAAGVWETAPDPIRVYNTAILLSPAGDLLTTYRKIHLFDALNVRESETMLAGETLPDVVSVGDFQVGLAICYDLRFPELFRRLALRGAELMLVPSAWYAGPYKAEHWRTLLRARAIENTSYVAGVSLTGSVFCGKSAVFDPFGVPLAEADTHSGLLFATLDPARIKEVRTTLPALKHIRRNMFGDCS